MKLIFATLLLITPVLCASGVFAGTAAAVHAIAMHGSPKYGPDFQHFDYVNPQAPKGGDVRLHFIGTFDTLNAFTLKGIPAIGLGSLYDTLLVSSLDEAFSEYGLLAESVEIPEDRSWAAFMIRKEARWHDGKPVTVEDVIFGFQTLKTKGHPVYRIDYAAVAGVEKVADRKVRFIFSGGINSLQLSVYKFEIIHKSVSFLAVYPYRSKFYRNPRIHMIPFKDEVLKSIEGLEEKLTGLYSR